MVSLDKAIQWKSPDKSRRVRACLRIGLGAFAVLFLGFIYLFQRFNLAHGIAPAFGIDIVQMHSYVVFIFNKTARLVLNDFACFLLIFAIFADRRYLKVAFYVFLFEIFILLPIYFVLKLWLEGDSEISSPLLSQLHRMIINPTLMILLMIGFHYQRTLIRARSVRNGG